MAGFVARTLLTLAMLLATESQAAVVDVFPGPGTPLQDAIDAANPKDTLYVHAGTYSESITVTKSLRLQARDGTVHIVAGCGVPAALTIAADDVRFRGRIVPGAITEFWFFRIEGGTSSVVDIQNRDRVMFKGGTTVLGSCAGVQRGLNVVNSSNVRIYGVGARGTTQYADAAIRIEAIPIGGRVEMSRSGASSAARGIVVANCPFASRVLLKNSSIGNVFSGEEVTDGIVLANSDGVRITRLHFLKVLDTGIRIDATSDDNRIVANEFEPTGGPNAVDDGADNCWRGNQCSDATCPGPEGCP